VSIALLFRKGKDSAMYAQLLGDKEGAQILQTTLTEEGDTDKKLTKLASSVINVAAARK
jgi:ferritin-like metal-binding protein YciE